MEEVLHLMEYLLLVVDMVVPIMVMVVLLDLVQEILEVLVEGEVVVIKFILAIILVQVEILQLFLHLKEIMAAVVMEEFPMGGVVEVVEDL